MEHQEGVGEPRGCAQEGGKPIQFGIAEFESNSESKTTSYSSAIRDCSFLFLLVFLIRLQGHSLLGEANSCVHRLVTNGAVV
jgi:hypothetical protein